MYKSARPNLLNSFLLVYFYELERKLNSTANELQNIKFQSEEANTDEFLKKYFKRYMIVNNDIKDCQLKQLLIRVDGEEYLIDIKKLLNYSITSVFLPENLSDRQKKEIAKSKKSVYTNPDLYLKISDGKNVFFESVELKSTKTNKIPGSSVQQVAPFEWVIFVKRQPNKVSVATGYYLNSITNKLPFPDRSPRPQIGFKTLADWNRKYRREQKHVLIVEEISELNQDKMKLLDDWQDFLADEWLEIIKQETSKRNEKWFNNVLRKFVIKFIDYTNNMNDTERQELRENIQRLVK